MGLIDARVDRRAAIKLGVLTSCLALTFASRVHALDTTYTQAAQLAALVDTLPQHERERENDLRRKHYPLVIFVPGILGSRLVRNSRDGRHDQLFGRLDLRLTNRHLLYDSSDTSVEASILDSFNTPFFNSDIYGRSLIAIRDLQSSDVKTLEIFPYDWRQSNAVSASRLNDWLCKEKRGLVQGRSIVFIAHSMGGLIVKKWLKDYHHEGWCTSASGKLNVGKVLFLGTPHFGSPKSVRAFADGFTLKADASTLFGRIFGEADKRTLASALNTYGPSFPSVYQLLPIYRSHCTASIAELRSLPPPFVASGDTTVDDIDLFSVTTWKRYGWPQHLPPRWSREDYYSRILPRMLDDAHELLCSLAKFRVEDKHKNISVTYIVGSRGTAGTEASYELKRITHALGEHWQFKIASRSGYVDGDGTVPRIIANGGGQADVEFIRNARSRHEDLLKDDELHYFIQYVFRKAQSEFDRAALDNNNPYRRIFLERYVQQGVLASMPPDAGAIFEDEYRGLREANAEILRRLNLTGPDVYNAARTASDPTLQAELYAIAASTDDVSLTQRAWAFNNFSLIQFNRSNYAVAADWAKAARNAVPDNLNNDLLGKATNTEAWSRYKLGQDNQARVLFKSAEQLGNHKAKLGLEVLDAGRI